MQNSSIFLILGALVAGVLALLILGFLSGSDAAEPQLISIKEELLSLPDDLDVAAASLFESEKGTLALMKVKTGIPSHMHMESNEVIYILSGEGTLYTSKEEKALSLTPGKLVIIFEFTFMRIESNSSNPLEFLIFLSPPSHEGNVWREDTDDSTPGAAPPAFEPIDVNITAKFGEYNGRTLTSPLSLALAGLSDGRVSMKKIYLKERIKNERDELMLLIECAAEIEANGMKQTNLTNGDLLIMPHGNIFTLTPNAGETCDFISFELEPESSSEN